jgi:hypothetical protein
MTVKPLDIILKNETVATNEKLNYNKDTDKYYEINKKCIKRINQINNEGYKMELIIIDPENLPDEYIKLLNSNHIKFTGIEIFFKSLREQGIDPYYWKGSKSIGHWNHSAHKNLGIDLSEYLRKILNL